MKQSYASKYLAERQSDAVSQAVCNTMIAGWSKTGELREFRLGDFLRQLSTDSHGAQWQLIAAINGLDKACKYYNVKKTGELAHKRESVVEALQACCRETGQELFCNEAAKRIEATLTEAAQKRHLPAALSDRILNRVLDQQLSLPIRRQKTESRTLREYAKIVGELSRDSTKPIDIRSNLEMLINTSMMRDMEAAEQAKAVLAYDMKRAGATDNDVAELVKLVALSTYVDSAKGEAIGR